MPTNGSNLTQRLGLKDEQVAAFCARHGIAELSVFGSALREDFRPDSDIDILVTFLRARIPTLGQFVAIHRELETLIGRPIDLLTRDSVERSRNPIRRGQILQTARVLYAA